MDNKYNVGDNVEVRFKDLTGIETWIPGVIVGYCNDYEVKLESNPYRFDIVYSRPDRIRMQGDNVNAN